jgi:hypothetical protein
LGKSIDLVDWEEYWSSRRMEQRTKEAIVKKKH